MNPEKNDNVTLAKLCGWTDVNWYEDNSGPGFWNGYPPPTIGVDAKGEWEMKKEKHHKPLPRYCSDLNAVAEVERGLTDEQWIAYTERHLKSQALDMPRRSCCLIGATARQRTIALIQTLTNEP